MPYKGKYRPKNPSKYNGDPTNVIYRSSWERAAFKWLDENPDILSWGSETLQIPYQCKTDGKRHRYFPDLLVHFKDGSVHLIEIKPYAQTQEPRKPKKPSHSKYSKSRFLREVFTYAKNQGKWEAANAYCQNRGWNFSIWTENELTSMGIKILTPSRKRRPRKKPRGKPNK